MFNVTTKYVKINDERKKVFMIKGDESYVKPTDTTLTIDESSIVTSQIKGFKIPTATVKVYRKIGSSTVHLYDGEEIIATSTIANNTDTVTFTNIYLAYGVDHDLYAIFVGNDSCYSSKSKKVKLNIALPSSLKTTITFTSPTTQISEGSNLTLNMTAKTNNVNVPNGTTISIYDGDTLKGTTTTSNGSATYTLTSLSRGKHTITARIEQTSSINATSTSYNVGVGYKLTFTDYPNTWISEVDYPVKIRVENYLGNRMTSGNVTFNSHTGALTIANNGVATITSSISSGGTYTATYGGSSTSITAKVYTPSSITMSPSTTITAKGHSLSIPINVTATGDSRSIGVIVVHSGTTSKVYLDSSGSTSYTYTGNARGENVTVTAIVGNVSKSITLKDYYMYWTPSQKYNISISGQYTEQSNGIVLTFPPSGIVMFNNSSPYNTLEFEVLTVSGSGTHLYRIGDETNTKSVTIAKGNKIKLIWTNDGIDLYINGEYDSTYSMSGVTSKGNWLIRSNDSSKVRSFSITNLKIY